MRTVPLDAPEIQFVGAQDLDVTQRGVNPRRLPAWTRQQFNVPAMDLMVSMPSGVRLRFNTSADRVSIKAEVTTIVYQGSLPRVTRFQIVTNGELGESIDVPNPHTFLLDRFDPTKVEFVAGETAVATFSALGNSEKTIEVWLPHNARVEVSELSVSEDATLSRTPTPNIPQWVHYGSSISHCMEADNPTGVWPAVAARLSNAELTSFGFAGQCHLDQYVARTIRDMPLDIFTMKVGINVVNIDSMRERTFAPALHGFLDTVRDGHPDTPICVISPIYCVSAESKPGPTLPGEDGKYFTLNRSASDSFGSLSLMQMRAIIQGVVEKRIAAGDSNLSYHDGLQIFGVADAVDMPDDLHPNSAGYLRMGQRFHEQVLSGLVQKVS
jgi:hypothetical protein